MRVICVMHAMHVMHYEMLHVVRCLCVVCDVWGPRMRCDVAMFVVIVLVVADGGGRVLEVVDVGVAFVAASGLVAAIASPAFACLLLS